MTKSNLIRTDYPKIRQIVRKDKKYYQLDCRRKGTTLKQITFKTKKEVIEARNQFLKEVNEIGYEAVGLTREDRLMYIECKNLLRPCNVSVHDAVLDYVKRHNKQNDRLKSKTIGELVKLWTASEKLNRMKDLSSKTLSENKSMGKKLTTNFGTHNIMTLESSDFEKYFNDLNVSNTTKSNIRRVFHKFYEWCIKHNHVTENIISPIKIQRDPKSVEIFKNYEVFMLIVKARDYEFDTLPYFAICAFAGLRPSECERLEFSDINLKTKQIHVSHTKTKVKEDRYVKIEDNLLSWLMPFKDKEGSIIPTNFRKKYDRVKKLANFGNGKGQIPWINDGLRHSFASYWLGIYHNRNELAEQMGNSVEVIKQHYRKAVSENDAIEYWAFRYDYKPEKKKLNSEWFEDVD